MILVEYPLVVSTINHTPKKIWVMSQKADHETNRQTIARFDQIINVGAATAGDFERLGISTPQDLIGLNPLDLYRKICEFDRQFHDPCVLDVFIAAIDYMNGNQPRNWWSFTLERKKRFTPEVDRLREKFARS